MRIPHLVDTPVVFALRLHAAFFAHCFMKKALSHQTDDFGRFYSERSPAKIPLRLAEAEEVELGFKRALFRHTAGKFLVILVYNCKIFLCLTKNGFS